MTLRKRIEQAERGAKLPGDLSHLSEAELDAEIARLNGELSQLTGGPTADEWNALFESALDLGWSDQKLSAAKVMIGVEQ